MKRTLIIPAAGLATRLRPVSNSMSKAMVPINGKPTIAFILDKAKLYYDDIRIVVGEHNSDLVRYIERCYSNVKLFKQLEQLGPLHAVACAMTAVEEDSILTIWLGDSIVLDYTPTKDHEIVVSHVPDYSRWCMVDHDGVFYDKPSKRPPTTKALVGVYTVGSYQNACDITKEILNSGDVVAGEFQISQLLNKFDYNSKNQFVTQEWYDVGDLPSLYETRSRLLTNLSRSENKIQVSDGVITKSGPRCYREIIWYSEVAKRSPQALKYLPQVYSTDLFSGSYSMSMCSGISVQELFAFEDLKPDTVEYIITKIFDAYRKSFIDVESVSKGFYCSHDDSDEFITQMFDRFIDRANKYPDSEWKTSYINYVNKQKHIFINSLYKVYPNVITHGDFHAGNIIFDFMTGSVKFIDPRGIDSNVYNPRFFSLYDLVKLYQSFYGDYIWIMTDTPVNDKIKTAALNTLNELMNDYNIAAPALIKSLVPIFIGGILEFHVDRPDHQQQLMNKFLELTEGN